MTMIRCDDMAQFLDVCAGLYKRGIVFTANATMLTIDLKGY